MKNDTIAERLVEERKRLAMTQLDVAEIAGITTRSQSIYEKGEGLPSGAYLVAVAAAGLDVQYVLTGARSSAALTPDERLLVTRYRTSPGVIQDAVLRMLLGDGSATAKPTLAGMFGNSAGRDANVTVKGNNNFLSNSDNHSTVHHNTILGKDATKKRRR